MLTSEQRPAGNEATDMQISGERASREHETGQGSPGERMFDALGGPMRWPLRLEWSRQGENGRTSNWRVSKGGRQRAGVFAGL